MKEWKKIIINDIETNYSVSTDVISEMIIQTEY